MDNAEKKIKEQQNTATDKEIEMICSIVENGLKLLNQIAPSTNSQKENDDKRIKTSATLAEWITKLGVRL